MDNDWMSERLDRWVVETYEPGATVSEIRRMPGNSGFSFGFTVAHGTESDSLVIRVPHPSAARQRNSDLLHQVEVIQAAERVGIPVPAVRSTGDESSCFELPYYVVDMVEGRSTHLTDASRYLGDDGAGLDVVFRDGMRTLAAIHEIDWQSELSGWPPPRPLAEEVDMWLPTLRKSEDSTWVEAGTAVRDLLIEGMPEMPSPTVVHGDFYSNNWLFLDGRITAVLDWELASIGSPGLDVGWICMMYDDKSWGPMRHRWSVWSPSAEFLVEAYEEAGGKRVENLDWYRALSGYRLACITARSIEHHRSGKRVDSPWEICADAFPYFISRATELLHHN